MRLALVMLSGLVAPASAAAGQIVDHIQEPHEVYDERPGKVEAAALVRKAADALAAAWIKLHTVAQGQAEATTEKP